MTVREQTEQWEKEHLSPYASRSAESAGRDRPISPDDLRTEYQRDRDRILHSKSFRRLKFKTQVFIAPEGDHFRTRLTHTLEVQQVARTIARALRLNEDLAEAIALGHDLGHTPFGHIGERTLDHLCHDGFRHYEQSLRVVEKLENGTGLNLTREVRYGIAHHSGAVPPSTLEGACVARADRVAYINHDIDDSVRAGIFTEEDLPARFTDVLGHSVRDRLNTLIRDVISSSLGKQDIMMSEGMFETMTGLRSWLFKNVYSNPLPKSEEG